jgi:VCBS repeat-containing protein
VVELNAPVNPTAIFTLYQGIDQAAGSDTLAMTFAIDATDRDGDVAHQLFTVNITDGEPTAHDVTATMLENGTANVVLAEGTDYTFGADANGHAIMLGTATVSGAPDGFHFDPTQLTAILTGTSGNVTVSVDPRTAFDALPNNATAILHIPYTVTDGDNDSKTGTINITVTGQNDAAAISGVHVGDVTEDGQLGAQGALSVADVDLGEAHFQIPASLAGTYGAFTFAADGTWTYTLDNGAEAVQKLGGTQTVADTLHVVSADGTAGQDITVTIHGTNDAPNAVADVYSGTALIEQGVGPGNTPVSGQAEADGNVLANDTDRDAGDSQTVIGVAAGAAASAAGSVGILVSGIFGDLTLNSDGSYHYALVNTRPATDKLAQGETGHDIFTYTMQDAAGATSSTTLTINIAGTNDVPTLIAGSPSVELTEAGYNVAGTAIATAQLTMNDIDSGDHPHFDLTGWINAGNDHATKDGTYGTFDLNTATGQLTYMLDNARGATEALQTGQTEHDSVAVSVIDDHGATASQNVSFTIHGSDDVLPLTAATDTIYTNRTGKITIFGESLLWNDQAADHGVLSIESGQGAGVGYNGSTDALEFTMPNSGHDQNFQYKVIDGSQSSTGDVTVHYTTSFNPTSGDDFFISSSGNGEGKEVAPFNLGAGNDVMFTSSAGSSYIDGGAGNDLIVGNTTNMTLRGGTGDDVLRAGNGGSQFLYGDDGNDILYSANGNGGTNTLHGGNGDDVLYALGVWNSNFYGDAGKDIIHGSGTSSQLWGGTGASGPDLESDTFAFSSSGWNPDTIRDFAKGSTLDSAVGDRIDLSAILDNALAAQVGSIDLSKFVNVVASGTDALVQVDPTGHSNWQNVAILSGAHTGDVANLVFEQAQLHQIAVHA